MAGPPIAEAQGTPGSLVQYYTDVALRKNGGSAVLLPLGLQENGGPDPRSKELPRTQAHQYFASTGHNLSGAFLRYWQSTGGLSTWGPPISEVKQRNGYTVQYCANAEFVLSGKSVVLGSVGARAWAALAVKGR